MMASKKKEEKRRAAEAAAAETAAEEAAAVKEETAEEAAAETEGPQPAAAEPEAPARDWEAELAAEKDRYLRLAAEYDNYRRRSQKERDALYADVKAETVKELLPVYDNLARALATGTEDEAFLKGVQMTMSQLETIFDKLGVKAIEAVGQPFDPEKHNAIRHIEDETAGENTVVEEFQKGFVLGDKVIRFAMVTVAN